MINEKYFKYDEPTEFINDRFKVCINNKYGYINEFGFLKIPLIYDYATDFLDEHAIVKLNNEYFCIDKQGERLNLFTHEEIEPLVEYCIEHPDEKLAINKFKSREVYENYEGIPNPLPHYDCTDVGFLKVVERNIGETKFQNGFSIVDNKKIFNGEGFNIIDNEGYPLLARYNKYTAIEPIYDRDDRVFKIKEKKYQNYVYLEKYGVINKKGEIILECEFDDIFYGYNDMFYNYYLQKNGRYGLGFNNYPCKIC